MNNVLSIRLAKQAERDKIVAVYELQIASDNHKKEEEEEKV